MKTAVHQARLPKREISNHKHKKAIVGNQEAICEMGTLINSDSREVKNKTFFFLLPTTIPSAIANGSTFKKIYQSLSIFIFEYAHLFEY